MQQLLENHGARLARYLSRHAGWLLRYESVDDLAQGVRCRALEAAGRYEDRGERQFLGWLLTLARRHLSDCRDHWGARRRHAAGVLRITTSDSADVGAIAAPAGVSRGPRTIAEQRELLVLAARALDTLPPRDRELIEWSLADVPLREQASRLGIAYAAAQRAGHRAMARLRRALAVLGAIDEPDWNR